MTGLSDAINQNTRADNTVYPLGIPSDWSQYGGAEPGSLPPFGWTAVTGWGQIYPEAGAPAGSNANAEVQIQGFTTYLLLNTGQWVEVQNQATNPVAGAEYVADFSNNASVPWTASTSNNVVTANAPPNGYVDHFYPETFANFTPGTVEGVFVEAQMRTTDPSAELVGNLGADWWANANAQYPNNAGAADSNWELLTTNWQKFYATNLTAAQLQANPPPGLDASSSGNTPTPTSTPTPTPSPSPNTDPTPAHVSPATVDQEINGLYVSLYGQPATHDGLIYWENVLQNFDPHATPSTQISATDQTYLGQQMTSGSPPIDGTTYFEHTYPSTMNDMAFVQALYQNAAQWTGNQAGDNYWDGLLQQAEAANGGNVTAARESIAGEFVHDVLSNSLSGGAAAWGLSQSEFNAAVNGQQVLLNKVEVSQYYANETAAANGGAILDYSSVTDPAFAAAKNAVAGVTSDASTVDAAIIGINTAVAHQDLSLI